MSYIVARKVEQEAPVGAEYGFALTEIDFGERAKNALDMNLDDEILAFVLGVVRELDELSEGEALVIWKEIF